MAQRNVTAYVERFTDDQMTRISELIDDEFATVIQTLEIRQSEPIAPEIKYGESGDDEFKYLVVNDSIQAMALIRRTDLNHYEVMLTSFY